MANGATPKADAAEASDAAEEPKADEAEPTITGVGLTRRTLARITVVVVVVAGIFTLIYRDDIAYEIRRAFPGLAVNAANARTSPPAPVSTEPNPLPLVKAIDRRPKPDPGTVALALVQPRPNVIAAVDAGAGRVWFAELPGAITLVDLQTNSDLYRLDLSDEVTFGGERGLIGLAADPGRTRLFAAFSNDAGDTQIDSWAIDPDSLALSQRVNHLVIGEPFRNHNGGHIAFGPDEMLWIGTGDGGAGGDPRNVAQDPDLLLGKMLRVEPLPEGGVVAPSTNGGWADVRPEIWAIGLRNPWRFSFDKTTGELWIGDVGQAKVEEISVSDFTEAQPNFGWKIFEGDRRYSQGEPAGTYLEPRISYGHDKGCSVAGGYVYRGSELPDLWGWYVFGDFCTGEVWAARSDVESPAIETLVNANAALLAFAELNSGELLVLAADGVYQLVGG